MSFLAPLWLTFAVLVIAVAAFHMFRRRQIEVPSTIIWRALKGANRSRRRLHPPKISLPLLLQVVIVLAAALALAEPLLGAGAGQARHTIYVLDASGSMCAADMAPSRFAVAKGKIEGDLSRLSQDSAHRFSLVAVGGRAELMAARQSDAGTVIKLLAQTSAGDGAGGWEEVNTLLRNIVRDDETTKIILVSDGGEEAARNVGADFPGVPVERRIVAGGASANAGLRAHVSPAPGPPNSWSVEGTVTFSGQALDQKISVAFRPEDGRSFLQWATIDVAAPAESGEAPFSQVFEFPAAGVLTLSLAEDAGPADNSQSFVLRATPRAIRVLYLGDGNAPVEQALLAMPEVELFTGTALPADDGSFDLVVADGITLPRQPSTNVLWLGSARLSGEAEPVLVDEAPTGWTDDHPLAANVDWRQVGPQNAYAFARLPGAAVLLQAGEQALVQARTISSGREVRLALDLEAGDWPEKPGFPVFVHNLLGWLGVQAGTLLEPACTAGTSCPLEASELAAPIFALDGEELSPAAGKGGEWLLDGANEAFAPLRAGLYVIGEGARARTIAVNPAVSESDLVPRLSPTEETASTQGPFGLWWWFAGAVLLLLIAEALLAGHGSDQFLRSRALRRGMPLAGRRRFILGLRLGAICAAVAAVLLLPAPMHDISEQVVLLADPAMKDGDQRRDTLLAAFADQECNSDRGMALVALNGRIEDPGCDLTAPETMSAPGAGANIHQALETALAMAPPGRRTRIVLAADGNEATGNLARAMPLLSSRGVSVDVLPLDDMKSGDALVHGLSVPPRVFAGDSFPLEAAIFSDTDQNARLTVRADGTVVSEREIRLAAGRNQLETVVRHTAAGQTRYDVFIEAAGDPTPENNRNAVVVPAAARPRIIVVTPQVMAGEYFVNALRIQGLSADVVGPEQAPRSIEAWLGYDGLVLMNVPAAALDTRQQQRIEELVRVHGRGLLILGGENSFGPGGYYGTLLEDLSPLSSRAPREEPVAAISFVIDRSGSMHAMVDGVSRLDIAKEATAQAVELLPDETEVSVVMFNSTADAVVPIQPRKAIASVDDILAPLQPLGGTSLVGAVDEALNQLDKVEAPVRHVVAMSDGLSQPIAFEAILKRAIDMGVTLSIVAIGDVADSERLADIADRGGGVFHQTRDFRALPAIMAQEAMTFASEPVERRTVTPHWVDRETPFLTGLADALPPIHSYVRTTAKPQARLHLAAEEEDGAVAPILASWAYGNGRVLSLATHGVGEGTDGWAEMQDFPVFWAQPLRHFLSAVQDPGLHLTLHRLGDEVVLDVGLLDESGRPVDSSDVKAVVRNQEKSVAEIEFQRLAPGHYQGRAELAAPGSYDVTVTAGDLQASAAIDLPYPARLDFSRANPDKLVALSQATGGRVLAGSEPLFDSASEWSLKPAWRPWLLLAMALLVAELALRYAPGIFGRLSRKPAPQR